MRSVSRVLDVSFDTVDKLLKDAGAACDEFHDRTVRGVEASASSATRFGHSFTPSRRTSRLRRPRSARRGRLLDVDGARCRSQADPVMEGRRPRCGIRSGADGRSSRPAGEPGAANDGRPQGISQRGRGSVRRGHRLRHAGEAVRRATALTGSRAALQPDRVRRGAQRDDHRQARPEAHQHELHGAGEPDHADEHAALHSADERVSASASRTIATNWRFISSATTSSASTRRCGCRPRWRPGSRIGFGRWTTSWR